MRFSLLSLFRRQGAPMSTKRLAAFALLGGGAFVLSPVLFGSGGPESATFKPFALFSDPRYTPLEVGALMAVLLVAVAGLLYAFFLARQVLAADTGTPKMQEVAAAVREGSNAYLAAQFKRIGPLIIVLTFLLFFTYTGSESAFRWGRSGAFLVGALFSWTVGFVGMRLATAGQPPGRRGRAVELRRGDAARLPDRDGHRHADGRPRPPRRHDHLPDLQREGLRGPPRLRLRRHAPRALHARRRRHLHEGGGRRRRPRRQDREGHPRGRPAQRGDDRRQRGRQRRRLRRHGGRHLRELRGDDRRRDDPRHGDLRPQGRHLPAPRPRHRRPRLDHLDLHGQGRTERHVGHGADERPPRLLDRLAHQHRRLLRARLLVPALRRGVPRRQPDGAGGLPWRRPERPLAAPELGIPRPRPEAGHDLPHRRLPRDRAEQGDVLLHAHGPRAGEGARPRLPDGPRDEHHPGHRGRLRVDGHGDRRHRGRHRPLGPLLRRDAARSSSPTASRWPASAC